MVRVGDLIHVHVKAIYVRRFEHVGQKTLTDYRKVRAFLPMQSIVSRMVRGGERA